MLKFITQLFSKNKSRTTDAPGAAGSDTQQFVKKLFADNTYLARKEKPELIVGVGLYDNVIDYSKNLITSNALALKDLSTRYNVKVISCTTGKYPSDVKEEKKIHPSLIASGISEVYFIGSNERARVTEKGLEKEVTKPMKDKIAAYEDICQRHDMSRDKVIVLDKWLAPFASMLAEDFKFVSGMPFLVMAVKHTAHKL